MTGILPCTCSSACQADRSCGRLPRFQAHLDAAQDVRHPRIHTRAEACANHLAAMVVAMTTWAREQNLTNAYLTVLTIEPPARESYPGQQRHRDHAQTSGLVFSIINLGEPESVAANVLHTAPVAADQRLSVQPTWISSDQIRYLGWLTLAGEGGRALVPPDVPARVM